MYTHILSASWKPSGRFLMVSVDDIIQPCFDGFRRWILFRMVSVVAGNISYGFRRWLFYGFRRGRKQLFMVSVAGCLMDSAVAGGSTILECIE